MRFGVRQTTVGEIMKPSNIFNLLGFCLVIASMTTVYYKNGSSKKAIFGSKSEHVKGCLGDCESYSCDPDHSSESCNTVKAFSVIAAVFSGLAVLMIFVPGMMDMFMDNTYFLGRAVKDVNESTVGFVGVAFFCALVSLLVALFSPSSSDGNMHRSLYEKSNSPNNSVELGPGFHMAWAAAVAFAIATIFGSCECAAFSEMFDVFNPRRYIH